MYQRISIDDLYQFLKIQINRTHSKILKNKTNLKNPVSIKETEFVLNTFKQTKLHTMIASWENCTEDCTKKLKTK